MVLLVFHSECGHCEAVPPPLAEAVRHELRCAPYPLSRTALRKSLRVNNARLGDALLSLQQRNLVVRGPNGWHLPPQPHPQPLELILPDD